jgi:hypothetical protein
VCRISNWHHDSRKIPEDVSDTAASPTKLTNNSRTIKYRKLSLIGMGIAVASLILMVIRWNDGIQGVEVYYGFPMSVGCGIFLSAQFLALTVRSSENIASATAIYCLVQQIGQIVGTSGSTAALRQLFRFRLGANLDGTIPSEKTKVRYPISSSSHLTKIMTYSQCHRSSMKFSKTMDLSQNCLKSCKRLYSSVISKPSD